MDTIEPICVHCRDYVYTIKIIESLYVYTIESLCVHYRSLVPAHASRGGRSKEEGPEGIKGGGMGSKGTAICNTLEVHFGCVWEHLGTY